ncbi:hypothetical protein [Halobaculum sp. MBLA0143]
MPITPERLPSDTVSPLVASTDAIVVCESTAPADDERGGVYAVR